MAESSTSDSHTDQIGSNPNRSKSKIVQFADGLRDTCEIDRTIRAPAGRIVAKSRENHPGKKRMTAWPCMPTPVAAIRRRALGPRGGRTAGGADRRLRGGEAGQTEAPPLHEDFRTRHLAQNPKRPPGVGLPGRRPRPSGPIRLWTPRSSRSEGCRPPRGRPPRPSPPSPGRGPDLLLTRICGAGTRQVSNSIPAECGSCGRGHRHGPAQDAFASSLDLGLDRVPAAPMPSPFGSPPWTATARTIR